MMSMVTGVSMESAWLACHVGACTGLTRKSRRSARRDGCDETEVRSQRAQSQLILVIMVSIAINSGHFSTMQ